MARNSIQPVRRSSHSKRLCYSSVPVHGQGHQHVVGGGQGVSLEKLEQLTKHQTSQPFSVKYFPDYLAWQWYVGMVSDIMTWLPAMGNMVTITSASVMWRKRVLLLFLPRLSLPTIRLYSTRLLPITEKMISPEDKYLYLSTTKNSKRY